MLVITRKETEGLLIGENIKLTVVRVTPTRVIIGIDAPPEVKVLRDELEVAPELEPEARP